MNEKKITAGFGFLSAEFAFSEKYGIIIGSLTNGSAGRVIEYIRSPWAFMPFESEGEWRLEGCGEYDSSYGLRPVRKAELSVSDAERRVTLHVISFPESPVIRYWFSVENLGEQTIGLSLRPSALRLSPESAKNIYHAYWYAGGHPRHDFGREYSRGMGAAPAPVKLKSNMTYDYVPLFVLLREDEPNDGIMAELDYAGPWELSIQRRGGELCCDFVIDNGSPAGIEPGKELETPLATVAVFAGDKDGLMQTVYDWQYRYLWDYTNSDYFAKTRNESRFWVFCSRNFHEQIGHRLAVKGLGVEALREAGYDIVWDDAGWSAYPGWPEDNYGSVFKNNYEGPDHRLSHRYYKKCGLKWLLWFAGKPSLGLLDTKQGAWGVYEYRTDGLSNGDLYDEQNFKKRVKTFLDADIRRSFHTCSGGASYSITFDIQKYANYHYAADLGAGPYNNYYLSYFCLPDRWGDTLLFCGSRQVGSDGSSGCYEPSDGCGYSTEFARSRLANVANPGASARGEPRETEYMRRDLEIYRYLKEKGVAGRFSYMFHPEVVGDSDTYYMQRSSRDRRRACIILKHRPKKRVILFPKGLLPDESYDVTFENKSDRFTRTGRELEDAGIRLEDCTDGELVYLNLTDAPWKTAVEQLPPPQRAVLRAEVNIGRSGVGVYWCEPGGDAWISSYEIARDGAVIGKVSVGHCFFDSTPGPDTGRAYTVRSVGASGERSVWTQAAAIAGSPLVFGSFGDHGKDFGESGWNAETSSDLIKFTPMTWVDPERDPAGDMGGTPNQKGGIEGYWEGGLCAKIGRGWCQASPDVYCSRSFTVRKAGRISLSGRAMKEWYHNPYGSDVEICVMKNGGFIVPWQKLERGDIDGACYHIQPDVKEGDVLRFVTGRCDPTQNDPVHWEQNANIIGWVTNITYDPPEADGGFYRYIACGAAGDRIEYIMPAAPDVYAVRLHFTEREYKWMGERSMRLNINGRVIDDIDIVAASRGGGTYSKVYNYIVPDADGNIRIALTSVTGGCTLDAIEVAAERDDITRVNCGGGEYVDWSGSVWEADSYYTGGEPVCTENYELRQASPSLYDKALYFSGRSGFDFSYSIPVKKNLCSVQLKFAELDPDAYRPFDVFIQGVKVCADRDALNAAGEFPMTADIRFDDIAAPDGRIDIRVTAKSDLPAILRAIEID